jgi:hypothetical protein
MRSPVPSTAPSVTATVLVTWIALGILTAAAAFLLLLEFAPHPIPSEVLDGLTTPASFGPRTT